MNAKEELLQAIRGHKIIAAWIHYQPTSVQCAYLETTSGVVMSKLKVNHSEKELKEFLEGLDFRYDNGYGLQELDGIVWLENGAWLTRGEYDGSEWWDFHTYPEIPEELKLVLIDKHYGL